VKLAWTLCRSSARFLQPSPIRPPPGLLMSLRARAAEFAGPPSAWPDEWWNGRGHGSPGGALPWPVVAHELIGLVLPIDGKRVQSETRYT
jgi:hypothetical protein